MALSRDLTKREREIVALIADGLTNDEISVRLGLAPDTVKFHARNIASKLDARNRAHVAAIYTRMTIMPA